MGFLASYLRASQSNRKRFEYAATVAGPKSREALPEEEIR